jgi:hypothetical protein
MKTQLIVNSKFHRLGEPRLKLPTFHNMWKYEFMHVHIPKSSQSQIATFVESTKIMNSATDEATKEKVSNDYRLHLNITLEERTEYNYKKIAVINEPDQYLSLIIDVMDQILHGFQNLSNL